MWHHRATLDPALAIKTENRTLQKRKLNRSEMNSIDIFSQTRKRAFGEEAGIRIRSEFVMRFALNGAKCKHRSLNGDELVFDF